MFKVLGKLFGSDKIIDAGVKAADAVWFTNEEKAEWHLRLLKAYEPFKIAQRLLALIFCIPYVTLIMSLFFDADILGHIRLLNELFGGPVTAILCFYFGGGAVEGIVRAGRENNR
jgi:hypothetical protein